MKMSFVKSQIDAILCEQLLLHMFVFVLTIYVHRSVNVCSIHDYELDIMFTEHTNF